ncbi:hypothetical protein [Salinithrix halophila]|uniref:Sporulation lipoprotein YhcN/YlaJ (Spore_YhcN_YlaJ) n=1 Tax=Salinithrix halophila TaxID=1485204 RepID=A0ABV8JFT1_9BACL
MARRWFFIFAVFLLFTSVACASNIGSEKPGRTMERAKVDRHIGRRYNTNNYDFMHDDGRFGIRNASPNLETSDWSRPTDTDDKTRIRKSVRRIHGVKDARVSILGGHVAILVTPERNVPRKDYEALQEHVLRRISFEMPRYEIRVRVGRSRWDPMQYLPGRNR